MYLKKSKTIVIKIGSSIIIDKNKIINAYLHDKISAEMVLQMPLCIIDDADKHILESEWQHGATWEYPFKRYKLAGYDKTIKSVNMFTKYISSRIGLVRIVINKIGRGLKWLLEAIKVLI